MRSMPMPVSMLGLGSGVSRPASSISYCTNTRFQYSRKRSQSQPGAQSGSSQPSLGAEVVVELGAGPARPGGPGGPPEVVLAAEADDALVREAVRLPQLHGLFVGGHLVVAAEDAHPHLARGRCRAVRELERPRDRLRLEVVAEREVAEHLEEREVPRRLADVLDVGRAEAALAGRDARRGRRLDAEVVRLVLLHAGGREEDAGVAGRDQAGRLAGEVTPLDEELSEQVADVGSVHVGPRVVCGVDRSSGRRPRRAGSRGCRAPRSLRAASRASA